MSREVTKEEKLEFKNQIKSVLFKPPLNDKGLPLIHVARNLQIVDQLTSRPQLGWRAERTIRKIALGKNDAEAIMALNLIDMIVKNCPEFRPLVNTRLFSNGLVKSLPKSVRDPQGVAVHNMDDSPLKGERISKSLILIESWATILDCWKGVYEELQLKNVVFPEPLKDETSPLDFCDLKVPAGPEDYVHADNRTKRTHTSNQSKDTKKNTQPKTRPKFYDGECRRAASLLEVLSDIIRANPKGARSDEMVQELKSQCEVMQKNIQSRVSLETHTSTINELLKVNDLFHSLSSLYNDAICGREVLSVAPAAPPVPVKQKSSTDGLPEGMKQLAKAMKTTNIEAKSKPATSAKPKQPSSAKPKQPKPKREQQPKVAEKKETAGAVTLDLLGLFEASGLTADPTPPASAPDQHQGGSSRKPPGGVSTGSPQKSLDILDLFGDNTQGQQAPAKIRPAPTITASVPEVQKQTSAYEEDAFMALAKKRS